MGQFLQSFYRAPPVLGLELSSRCCVAVGHSKTALLCCLFNDCLFLFFAPVLVGKRSAVLLLFFGGFVAGQEDSSSLKEFLLGAAVACFAPLSYPTSVSKVISKAKSLSLSVEDMSCFFLIDPPSGPSSVRRSAPFSTPRFFVKLDRLKQEIREGAEAVLARGIFVGLKTQKMHLIAGSAVHGTRKQRRHFGSSVEADTKDDIYLYRSSLPKASIAKPKPSPFLSFSNTQYYWILSRLLPCCTCSQLQTT